MYNDTLMEAMKDWEMMSRFITQIETAYQNTVTVMFEAVSMQLITSAIAISDKATGTARLLHYNIVYDNPAHYCNTITITDLLLCQSKKTGLFHCIPPRRY